MISRTITLTMVLSTTVAPLQNVSVKPSAAVILAQTTLRLGMRKAEVIALLAPKYEIQPGGFVVSRDGPPFEFAGAVGFSNDGVLKYVSRDWSPAE